MSKTVPEVTHIEKFILDATAGFRQMWYDKQQPNTIYLDARPECEPDIVCDFRDLKQFEDEKFRLIIFDPPHMIKKYLHNNTNTARKYGLLEPDTWASDIKQASRELWRVLKTFGILLFKWNTQYLPANKVADLFPVKPLIYQVSATSSKYKTKTGKHEIQKVRTVWFCFMKIPEASI